MVKKKIDSYQWKINSNTNWNRLRETMQNNIVKTNQGIMKNWKK